MRTVRAFNLSDIKSGETTENNSESGKYDVSLLTEVKANGNGKQRVLQRSNKRVSKPESPSILSGVEGEQRVGRGAGLEGNDVPGTDGKQQQSAGREGNILPGHADILEPALVDFNADDNDTRAFNPSQKYSDNMGAIETLIALIRDRRKATAQEKEILSRYVGFGGLKDVLLDPNVAEGWGESNARYRAQLARIIELTNEFDRMTGKPTPEVTTEVYVFK